MNPGLDLLCPYPFERLAALQAGLTHAAAREIVDLSIGEPQHPTPRLITAALSASLHGTAKYPATRGTLELRTVLTRWLARRFTVPGAALDPAQHVLPVNGTREALFAIVQCVIDRRAPHPAVIMPNPFYQIYEGAALLAGAEPIYLRDAATLDFDAIPAADWRRCQVVFVCSPSNPTGDVLSAAQYQELLARADKYNFIIVADECYSEIYYEESTPPIGLLEVAWHAGREDFSRCLVMGSLSKRSNAPGLRSGYVAGDATIIERFLRYRTYHGCAMPLHVQHASIAAWTDEKHVVENRRAYRAKFDAVVPILSAVLEVATPRGGFYLWPRMPGGDDEHWCRRLWQHQAVLSLPGRYLGRAVAGHNPGAGRLRLALVPDIARCVDAAHRIRAEVESSI